MHMYVYISPFQVDSGFSFRCPKFTFASDFSIMTLLIMSDSLKGSN